MTITIPSQAVADMLSALTGERVPIYDADGRRLGWFTPIKQGDAERSEADTPTAVVEDCRIEPKDKP